MRVDEVQQGSRFRWRVSAGYSQVERTGGDRLLYHYGRTLHSIPFFFCSSGISQVFFPGNLFSRFLFPCVLWPGFSTQKTNCSFFFLFLSKISSFIKTKVIKKKPGQEWVENWGLWMDKTLKYAKLSAWIMLASGLCLSPTCHFPSNDMWIIAQQDNWWAPSGFWYAHVV